MHELKEEQDKNKLILLGIVAIVAIVAVALGFMNSAKGMYPVAAAQIEEDSDLVGGAADLLSPQQSVEFARATLHLAGFDYKVISGSDININDFSVFVDMNGSGKIGDSSTKIAGREFEIISVENKPYFFLKDYGVLQYKGADKKTYDNPLMKFKDLQYGNTIEMSYSVESFNPLLCL